MTHKIPEKLYGQLTPRYLGPIGNRVSAVAGVVRDHLTYYAGAAAGGIFRTQDGGTTWKSIFDDQAKALGRARKPERVASIGALAVSESHPHIVWAGTGESWIRGPLSIGNGIYKSTDKGDSWTRMGLIRSGRISKIIVHPHNPNTVWVAAVGSCYDDKRQERGVYKTTDGGKKWRRVLHVDNDTGCSDLAIDPHNPRHLYAGMWSFKLRSWTRISGGPGGGIYKSTDGGNKWRKLKHDLPNDLTDPEGNPLQMGKISISVSRKDPKYVYANIETGDGAPTFDFPHVANGQLFQSKDSGKTWKIKSYNRNINSRAAYYTRNSASPDHKEEVYFFAPMFTTTKDGGDTLHSLGFPEAPGVDHHEGWIDPHNGDRMIVAHDNGVSITQNRCESWYKIQLPIAQIYQLGLDDEIPYNVYGNVQDWIMFYGPSNARIPYNAAQGDFASGKIVRGCWTMGGNGECGWSIPDPKDTDLVWTSGAGDGPNGGSIAIINKKSGQMRMVTVKPQFTTGAAPKDLEYRFHWHFPLALSPHDNPKKKKAPRRAYAGSQYVHVSDDQGQSWYRISKELTGKNEKYLQSSGGLTADNLNVRMAYTTSFIIESPLDQGVLWVGTGDQRLWLGTQKKYNGRWRWTEITSNIKDLPNSEPGEWAKVSCIHPSVHEAGTVYVAFDKHQGADPAPYIYKTEDYGLSWKKITQGVKTSVFSYVHWITEDPKCKGLLFMGTENNLFISYNGGEHWETLPGLPPAPVSGITVQPRFDDLVISTFGRGFYIYDDITALRSLQKVIHKDFHLFEFDRPVYRFMNTTQPLMVNNDNDPTVGSDLESPAPITFYLKEEHKDVTIRIYQKKKGKDNTIRTISNIKGTKGINRVWWDLMSDTTQTIILRSNPPNQIDTPYCKEDHVRPFSDPIAGTSLSWMVIPGKYEVELEVMINGKKRTTRKTLKLLRDPNSPGTMKELKAQNKLSIKVSDALTSVANDVNTCEWLKYQSHEILEKQKHHHENVHKALKALIVDLEKIEAHLYQERITGNGEDLARFPGKLVSSLSYLGSIVGSGDYPPTKQAKAEFKVLHKKVRHQKKSLEKTIKTVKPINDLLKKEGLPTISLKLPDDYLCPDLFNTGPAF